jgi:hypothetical protein
MSRIKLVTVEHRKGLKQIVVDMGTFDYHVAVAIGPHRFLQNYVRWANCDPGYTLPDDEYGAFGEVIKRRGYAPLIWIPHRPRTPREHGTLAHECAHAAIYMMDWAGIESNLGTQELLAHAIGYLVTSVLENA